MRHAPAPRRSMARPTRHMAPAPQWTARWTARWNALRRLRGPGRDDARTGSGLRRFWPAGLTSAGTASYVLASLGLAGLIVIVTALAVAAAGNGRISAALSGALVTCSGVLALVALTLAVAAGVVATGRHLLPASARVMVQVIHRAVSLIAVGFLAVHILLEVASARAGLVAAVVPFTGSRGRFYLGLGTIASDLEIAIVATSIARMRYAASAHPRLWRAIHLSIYVAWPLAIVHGLFDQQRPAAWLAWTYLLCVALVAIAVATRYTLRAPLHRPRAEPAPELPPGPSLSPYGPIASHGPVPSRHDGAASPRPAGPAPVHRALPPPSYPRDGDLAPPWAPAPRPRDF